jgi:glycosyltransferase involved in cell wall biosynthesis
LEGVERIELPAIFPVCDIPGRLLRPWQARKAVRSESFDLVHAFNASEPFVWQSAMALYGKIPLVVDWDNWHGQGGLVERRALKGLFRRGTTRREESLPPLADAVTVVSEVLQERAERLGVPREKLHRVGNGADPEITERLDRAECRRRLGLPEDRVLVLSPEANNPALPVAIGAFLNASGERKDVLFVAIGDSSSLKSSKIDARVRFTGSVPNETIPSYLAAADAMVFPLEDNLEDRARFPLLLGNCLAAERAVVASDVGETGRFLREQECGLLARDEEEFTRRLADLLDSPERRRHLGFLGHRTALHRLDWDTVAEKLLKIYEGLVKKPEGGSKSRTKKENKS